MRPVEGWYIGVLAGIQRFVMVEKDWLVNLLRHLGYTQEADAALREMPDQISREELKAFGDRHGISRDELTNRSGGSP